MNFDVRTSIWCQLFSKLSRLIAAEQRPSGFRIPSVRELAAVRGVDPDMVQKAPVGLKRTGVAETRYGLGRYVVGNTATTCSLGRRLAYEAARIFVAGMKTLTIDLLGAEVLTKI